MSTLSDLDWPLRTDRLSLRQAVPTDASTTWTWRRLPEVSEWLAQHPTDFEEYAALFARPARLQDTIVVEHEGVPIGDLMLHHGDAWSQVEVAEAAKRSQATLGWVFHPEHSGRGLATESVRALIDLAFGPLGLRRVVAECFCDNEASWRLMERVGMRREAHNIKDSLHRTRGWIDGYTYALLAEEWRSR